MGDGHVIVPGVHINANDPDRYRRLFAHLDSNHDGKLSRKELWDGMYALRMPCTRYQMRQLVRDWDSGQKGYLTEDEFVDMLATHERVLRRAWETASEGWKDKLTLEDLTQAMHRAGIPARRTQVASMVSKMDLRNNGVVGFDEWLQLSWLLMPYNNEEMALRMLLNIDSGIANWQVIAASGVANCISRTVLAPLDRAKLLLQAGPRASPFHVSHEHNTLFGVLKKMYRHAKLRGMFAGNFAGCMLSVCSPAITFTTFDKLKRVGCRDPALPTPLERAVFAGTASCVTVSTLFPLLMVQTRLSVASVGAYHSMIDVAKSVIADQGVRGLYRGITASMMYAFPFTALQMTTYGMLKEALFDRGQLPTVPAALALGGAATLLATVVTHPLETIAVGLRTQGMELPNGRTTNVEFTNLRGAWRYMFQHGGVTRLFQGLAPALKHVPAVAMGYGLYECGLGRLRSWLPADVVADRLDDMKFRVTTRRFQDAHASNPPPPRYWHSDEFP